MPETKRLYHFMHADHALQAIERRRLKTADLDKVNDPYESLTVGFNSREEEESFFEFHTYLANMFCLVCFSETYRDPLLWGHYADRFKGICLGFDTEHYDDPTKDHATKIAYVKDRIDIIEFGLRFINGGLMEDNTSKTHKILYIKSCNWEHEKEWRIWDERTEPDPVAGLRFIPFGNQIKLREILIGLRCTEENADIKSRLDKLAAAYSPDPPKIFLTQRSLSTFDIEKKSF